MGPLFDNELGATGSQGSGWGFATNRDPDDVAAAGSSGQGFAAMDELAFAMMDVTGDVGDNRNRRAIPRLVLDRDADPSLASPAPMNQPGGRDTRDQSTGFVDASGLPITITTGLVPASTQFGYLGAATPVYPFELGSAPPLVFTEGGLSEGRRGSALTGAGKVRAAAAAAGAAAAAKVRLGAGGAGGAGGGGQGGAGGDAGPLDRKAAAAAAVAAAAAAKKAGGDAKAIKAAANAAAVAAGATPKQVIDLGSKLGFEFQDAGGGSAFGDIFGFGEGNFIKFQDAGGGDPFGDVFGFGDGSFLEFEQASGPFGFSSSGGDAKRAARNAAARVAAAGGDAKAIAAAAAEAFSGAGGNGGAGRTLSAGGTSLPPGVDINDIDKIVVIGGTSIVQFKDGSKREIISQGNTAVDRLGNTYSTDQFNPKLLTNRLSGAQQAQADAVARALEEARKPFDPRGAKKKADPADIPGGYIWGAGAVPSPPSSDSGNDTSVRTTGPGASAVRTGPPLRLPDKIGTMSSVFIPEAARGKFYDASDLTPIGPAVLRYDAQWGMGAVTEEGAPYVGSLRFVDADASQLKQIGKPHKGEIWHDAGLACAGDSQPGESVKWVPVIRVDADLPPGTHIPKEARDEIIVGEEKEKGPIPFPGGKGRPLGPKPGGGGQRKLGGIDERDNPRAGQGPRKPVEGETESDATRARQAIADALGLGVGLVGDPSGEMFRSPGGYRVPQGPRYGTDGATSGLTPESSRERGQADAVDRARGDDPSQQDANGWCGRDYGAGIAEAGPAYSNFNINGEYMFSLAPTGADPNDVANYRPFGVPSVTRTATDIQVLGYGPSGESWSVPTRGSGVPVDATDGLTLSTFPIIPFGRDGAPASLENSLRFTQAQAEVLRRQFVALAGGSGHLEASLGAVGRNRDGRMPQAHSFSTHIGAEQGAKINTGGATAEVYSILDGNAGSSIIMNGDGVFNVRREIRGPGYTRDYRPLVHLQNDVGTTGRVAGDLIASSDYAFAVNNGAGVIGQSFTVPTEVNGSTPAFSVDNSGILSATDGVTAPDPLTGRYQLYALGDNSLHAIFPDGTTVDLGAAGGGGGNTHDLSDAATSTISEHVVLDHVTTGTAAAGFGSGTATYLENAAGSSVEAMRLSTFWDVATDTAESSGFEIRTQEAGANAYPLFYDHSGAGGNSLMQLEANRINLAAVSDGVHISGDVTLVTSGAKLTMDGRLDPGSVEFTDRNGSASLIPGSAARGFDYDSTVNAARPLWTREGTRTAVALFSDLPTAGIGLDASFNVDISPLTTEATPAAGDWLILEDAGGTILKVDWGSIPGAPNALLDGSTHTDTAAGTVARGDLITGQTATPAWTRKAIGAANTVFTSDATDCDWSTVSALFDNLYGSTPGRMFYRGSTVWEAVAVPTVDNDVLTWDNGAGAVIWQAAAGSNEFADDVFRVQDNVDATKELAFELSGVTTLTTRTVTIPDASGTMVLDGTTPTFDWLNIGSSTTSAVATGDLAAGDGTREVFWDASVGTFSVTSTAVRGIESVFNTNATAVIAAENTNAGTAALAAFVGVNSAGDSVTCGVVSPTYSASSSFKADSAVLTSSGGLAGGVWINASGADAPIDMATANTAAWRFLGGTSGRHLVCPSDNSYDIGASGATRPRTGYFGTSIVVGTLTMDGNSLDRSGTVAIGDALATSLSLGRAAITTTALGTLAAADVSITGGSITGITDLAIADGGTGAGTATAAFDALSPLTTLGDTLYGGASGTGTRLAGNTTATKQFLNQTGTGAVSAAPVWAALVAGDIPDLSATYATAAHSHVDADLPSELAYEDEANVFTALQEVRVSTGSNAVVEGFRLNADNSAAVGGAGLGVAWDAYLEHSVEGVLHQASRTAVDWDTATAGSEDAAWTLSLLDGGTIQECLKVQGSDRTITVGIWGATDVAVLHGGTGASTAGDARTNLGVAIGSNVQAWDADLDTYAANPLTAGELGELQNIGATTISAAQWGYVGAADQQLAQADSPTFAALTLTAALTAANGGTGFASYTVGDTLYADTTTTLAKLAAGVTSGHVLTSNGSGAAPSWQAAAGGGGDHVVDDTNTSSSVEAVAIKHTISSGTPAIGLGVSAGFYLDNDASSEVLASQIESVWTLATAAAEDADLVFKTKTSGLLTEMLRLHGGDSIEYASGVLVNPSTCEGRLTLTNGTSVTTSDVSSATIVYFEPHSGSHIALWDGSKWALYDLGAGLSAATSTGTASLPHDCFVYYNGSSMLMELVAWTNATTRATALTTQGGVYVKSGATGRRYVGTVYLDGSKQCYDTKQKRWVWNYYNRVRAADWTNDTTDSWSESGAGTWTAVNGGGSVWKWEMVVGVDEDCVTAQASLQSLNSSSQTVGYAVAIELDWTTGAPTRSQGHWGASLETTGTGDAGRMEHHATWAGRPGIGYHFLQAVETSQSATAVTVYGDAAANSVNTNSGMQVDLWR